jgi:putative ABC transport system ATP-binding protein
MDLLASGAPAAISCRGLTKDLVQAGRRVPVLRGLDLELPFGEISLLVGPSGCGKTTFLSLAAGLLDRDQGRALVLGTDLQQLNELERAAFRRQNLGLIFQEYHLLPALTAVENVAVSLIIKGSPFRPSVACARELLSRLDLSAQADLRPAQLSGGERQRIAIARALIHQPRLILCDEPTAALDHQNGLRVMELLAQAARRPDRAVVVVTHDRRVFRFARSIAFMEDGRIQKIETRPEAA